MYSQTKKVTTYKAQVQRFIKELEQEGEFFFTTGSAKKDYEHITEVLEQQGYWSGIYNRYYFSDELFLVNSVPRVFGV